VDVHLGREIVGLQKSPPRLMNVSIDGLVERVLSNLVAKLLLTVGKDDAERIEFLKVFVRDVIRAMARNKQGPTIN
jgi:hypothetical protein